MNETLNELYDRINEMEQIIDIELDDADAGSIRSRQLIINASNEIEIIRESIDQLAMANCLV
jgi:hypothetical protein